MEIEGCSPFLKFMGEDLQEVSMKYLDNNEDDISRDDMALGVDDSQALTVIGLILQNMDDKDEQIKFLLDSGCLQKKFFFDPFL